MVYIDSSLPSYPIFNWSKMSHKLCLRLFDYCETIVSLICFYICIRGKKKLFHFSFFFFFIFHFCTDTTEGRHWPKWRKIRTDFSIKRKFANFTLYNLWICVLEAFSIKWEKKVSRKLNSRMSCSKQLCILL